jgi:hypothetical protein
MIIIPGMYRSGTTYLCKCLTDAGYSCGEFYDEFWEDYRLHGANMVERSVNDVNDSQCPFKYEPSEKFVEILTGLKKEGDHVLKDPMCARFMRAYAQVFPDAKFILCIRNGLSTVWSQVKRGKGTELKDMDSLTTYSLLVINAS